MLPEDVRSLAHDVLRHRLVLTYEALAEGVDADALLDRVLGAVAGAGGLALARRGGVSAASATPHGRRRARARARRRPRSCGRST